VALSVAGDRAEAANQLRKLLARIPQTAEHERTRRAAQTLLQQISPDFRR
jgi:hypothetical protein